MRNLFICLILGGVFFKLSAQEKTNEIAIEYYSNVPFNTNFSSKYYNLDSHLLMRDVIKKINETIRELKIDEEYIYIRVQFNGDGGKFLSIPVVLYKKDYIVFQKVKNQIEHLNERLYDWLNRSFRSSIPYN